MRNCCCQKNNNNSNIIIAAVIALILINLLDTECTDNLSNLLVSVGDLMQLGNTGGCAIRGNDFSNFYC